MMGPLAYLLFALTGAPPGDRPAAGDAERLACELRPTAAQYEGRELSFRGRYSSDGRERARIDIEGCEHRYGVGRFAAGVPEAMDPENPEAAFYLPRRSLEAVFRVRIVVVSPNTLKFQDDDGVRLSILDVDEIDFLTE